MCPLREAVLAGAPGAGRSTIFTRLAAMVGCPAVAPAAGAGRRLQPPGSHGPGGRPGGVDPVEPAAAPYLPAVALPVRAGPLGRTIWLVDTPGLSDLVDPDPGRRRLQAEALRRLAGAAVVLHVVDAHRIGEAGTLTAVDLALGAWGRSRPGYAVVAAKMDLPWAQTGLAILRRTLAPTHLFPVAAAAGQGLAALREFLRRWA